MSKRNLSVLAILVASVTTACRDSVAPPKAATIEVNSGADQQGFTGEFVTENPEVLVRDGNGQPVAEVTVKFAVTAAADRLQIPRLSRARREEQLPERGRSGLQLAQILWSEVSMKLDRCRSMRRGCLYRPGRFSSPQLTGSPYRLPTRRLPTVWSAERLRSPSPNLTASCYGSAPPMGRCIKERPREGSSLSGRRACHFTPTVFRGSTAPSMGIL